MKNKINIVLTGVGGQGVITAANILGKSAIKAGINVFTSEIHGMAQRGGSVECAVRFGNVSGPLIANGRADAIVSTEPIEALRCIHYSNKNTKIITDITPVIPFTVSLGLEKYPDLNEVFEELKKYGKLYKINASKIANEIGDLVVKNTVLLGALVATDILPFEKDILLDTILENVPIKYRNINKVAFEKGFKVLKSIKEI